MNGLCRMTGLFDSIGIHFRGERGPCTLIGVMQATPRWSESIYVVVSPRDYRKISGSEARGNATCVACTSSLNSPWQRGVLY